MSGVRVSAPGKLMIAGEYAVLEGAPALVAAINRRIILGRPPSGVPTNRAPVDALGPEIEQVFELQGQPRGDLHIDRSALYREGRKLGLGSSAAGAAAAAALALYEARETITRERVFELALRAHRAVAPKGSGVDVLASSFGGLLLANPSALEHPMRLGPEKALGGISMSVIDTGKSARTSTFLEAIEAHRRASPRASREAFRRLCECMEAIEMAVLQPSPTEVMEGIAEYGARMEALGAITSLPIVEERLKGIAALARSFGGVSKPSGAGGGDIALALFRDAEAKQNFERRATERGFVPVALCIDPEGAHVEADE